MAAMQDTIDALKRVAETAALAGLKGRVNDEMQRFEMGFEIGDKRTQMVYIRYLGKGPGDKEIVTLFSPAKVVQKGFLKGMSKDMAIELLKLNSQIYFARFGILENDKEIMIMASIDAILETLDADELKAGAWAVAIAADRFEKDHGGKDDF